MILSRQLFQQGNGTRQRQLARRKVHISLGITQDEKDDIGQFYGMIISASFGNYNAPDSDFIYWYDRADKEGVSSVINTIRNNVNTILGFYHNILRREVYADEIAGYGWFIQLAKGNMTADQIANAFTNSEEYKQMVAREQKATLYNQASLFVSSFYRAYLGREPYANEAGYQMWIDRYVKGELNKDQIQKAIQTSPEAINKLLMDKWGIGADEATIKFWSDELGSGRRTWENFYKVWETTIKQTQATSGVREAFPNATEEQISRFSKLIAITPNLNTTIINQLLAINPNISDEDIISWSTLMTQYGAGADDLKQLSENITYTFSSTIGRNPTIPELRDFMKSIITKETTLSDLKNFLMGTDEYKKLYIEPTNNLIRIAFNTTLGRNPTDAELNFYRTNNDIWREIASHDVQSNELKIEIFTKFIKKTDEYKKLAEVQTGQKLRADLITLFNTLISRNPTDEELSFLLPKLQTGEFTLDSIRRDIMKSQEYISKHPPGVVAPVGAGAGVGWLAIAGTVALLLL